MRKILVILALLGGAYWWFSKPPQITARPLGPAVKASAPTAPTGNSVSPNPAPSGGLSTSQPAPVRKSPLNSALNLRQTQADRVNKQQKQQQSLP